MSYPSPHFDKLNALLENIKLPEGDQRRVKEAVEVYKRWHSDLTRLDKNKSKDFIGEMVDLLNKYKNYIDIDLIFDSEDDFLYRQKGQLKLDNSIIEEFLPHLVFPYLAEMPNLFVGPSTAYSSIYFSSNLYTDSVGGGLEIRTKDQDFAITKQIYIKASHSSDFKDSISKDTFLAYVVAECKTNLDKTMFQEACATAHDVKSAVTGAKYFLLCEWLDMTPISTAPTDIDEVLILRKSKRLASNIRKDFSNSKKRAEVRDKFIKHLKTNPLQPEMFKRFIDHVIKLMRNDMPGEDDVIQRGYF